MFFFSDFLSRACSQEHAIFQSLIDVLTDYKFSRHDVLLTSGCVSRIGRQGPKKLPTASYLKYVGGLNLS